MKRALRNLRDRLILALRGAPPSVLTAYRDALEQAGVDGLVLDAYGPRGLGALKPSEHQRLVTAGRASGFAVAPRATIARDAGSRPRMVLHFGAPKTGSSSVQMALHADRRRLWDHGILYPASVPFFATRSWLNHNSLVTQLVRTTHAEDPGLLAFRRYVTELSAGATLVILSAETLYGTPDGDAVLSNLRAGDPSYWGKRVRLLSKLADYVSGFEVTPILWLRSPDAFADSLYRQLLRGAPPTSTGSRLRHSRDFGEFRATGSPLWDYDRQVAAIEDVFGEVVVHRLEDGDPVGAMYSHLSVDAPEGVGKRANPSADARVALWLRDFHGGGTRQRGAFGLSAEAAAALREGSGGSMWESEDARAEFLAGLSSMRFGVDFFPPPKPLAAVANLTPGDSRRLTKAFEAWRASHPEESFHEVPQD